MQRFHSLGAALEIPAFDARPAGMGADVPAIVAAFNLAHARVMAQAELVRDAVVAHADSISPGWRTAVVSPIAYVAQRTLFGDEAAAHVAFAERAVDSLQELPSQLADALEENVASQGATFLQVGEVIRATEAQLEQLSRWANRDHYVEFIRELWKALKYVTGQYAKAVGQVAGQAFEQGAGGIWSTSKPLFFLIAGVGAIYLAPSFIRAYKAATS